MALSERASEMPQRRRATLKRGIQNIHSKGAYTVVIRRGQQL